MTSSNMNTFLLLALITLVITTIVYEIISNDVKIVKITDKSDMMTSDLDEAADKFHYPPHPARQYEEDLPNPETRNTAGELFQHILQSTINPTELCYNNTRVFIIAFVVSTPPAFAQRMTIRNTWADSPQSMVNGTEKQVLKIFVIGLPVGGNTTMQDMVSQESARYGDILQGNFQDTAKNATVKYIMALKWTISNYPDAKFIYWGDDKLAVIYENLFAKLEQYGDDVGFESGKWIGHTAFVEVEREHRPRYCQAKTGFVLSMKAVAEIDLTVTWNVIFSPYPDVFTSSFAEYHEWMLVNVAGFTATDEVKNNHCDLITFRYTSSSYKQWMDSRHQTLAKDCLNTDTDHVWIPSHKKESNTEYFNVIYDKVTSTQDACMSDSHNVFIVAGINSRVTNFDNRNAIRETWAKVKEFFEERIMVFFALGLATTEADQRRINKEMQEHGDIIQGKFVDTYRNVTLKTIMGLKWVAEHCSSATFLYKGDDDVFVNVYNVIAQLKYFQANGEMLHNCIMGNVQYDSKVFRRGKWNLSEEKFNGEYYPPYCSGGGYVMTGDLAFTMYNLSKSVTLIPQDDSLIGILGKKLHTQLKNMPNSFKMRGWPSDTCTLRNSPNLLAIHGFNTPSKMRQVWRNYTDANVLCET